MYLLDLPPEAIDSRRFEEASESGRARLAAGDPVGAAHELRSALQLWRGSALPDLAAVPGALASVARLQSLRLSTLADRIDAESLLGRHSRLIPELQDLVRKHPLNERFVGQLMTSLYWEGRQAEALAAYAAAADRLGDELGIDPCPALRDLHGRLLRQEVGPVATEFAEFADSAEGVHKTDSASGISGDLRLVQLMRAHTLSAMSRSVGDPERPGLETDFNSRTSVASVALSGGGAGVTGGVVGPRVAREGMGAGRASRMPGSGATGVEVSGGVIHPGVAAVPGVLHGVVGSRALAGAEDALTGGATGVARGTTAVDGAGPDGAVVYGARAVPSCLVGPGAAEGRPVGLVGIAAGGAAGPGVSGVGSSGRIPGQRSGEAVGSGGGFAGLPHQARVAPVALRPDPPSGLPVPPAALPGPPVVPGSPASARLPMQTTPLSPSLEPVVPQPSTLSVEHCAPILPGVPETGPIPSIGTKRTAFGAAYGAGTVGRTGELGAALELLRRPDVRLVTVVGPGGAGKTRLAAQIVTRRLAEAGREVAATRVLVVPLGGTPAADNAGAEPGAGLAARLRRILGVVPDTPGEAPIDTVCRALAAIPCLLVLDDLDADDVEAEPMATVTALIARVGGLRVLATARRALGVPGEQVIGLVPLAMPWAFSGAGDVQTVRSAEAVRLFRERARAVLPAFEVTEQNAAAVGELCRALDGLPLALELAAARTRSHDPEGIGRDLNSATAARRPGAMLEAVLEWTVNLLEDTEKLVLSQLSVFVGGATLDAAERVCGPVPGPGQVIDVIGRLADKNLLLIDETGRLGLLAPVREHARRLLAADPEEEAACADRHAAYFAEFADALPPLTDRWLDPSENTDLRTTPNAKASAVGQLGGRAAEYDNLSAAAAHAEGRDGEVFARLVAALLDQGLSTGRWELGDAPAWLARAQAQRPTARTGARLLLAGGALALFGGNPLAAAEILAQIPAGATSGEAGAVVAIRVALMRAVAARSLGRCEEALAEAEGALERVRALRRPPETLWHAVLNVLADVLDDLGRTAVSIGHWQRSRHRAAAGGDPTRLAYPLAKLALAAQDRGEDALARVLIGQARSAATSGGRAIRSGVAVADGLLELRHGNHQAALTSLRQALREAHAGGKFFTLPRIVALLGVAHWPHDPHRAAALLAVSASWGAQRSIVVTGRRERELISAAESALEQAGRTDESIRRAAARGAAVPFGSLIGVLRLDPESSGPESPPELIDLTGADPIVHV
ncbi:BTAD domain-containing putative transcriptional regulator [Kineosporia sp. NBRC 101677]|uniref:BTAD domain-containing putative transcriptional regulator n=1 Tax=Kineosporia sp. NBRC 101677 TaxID=3032197 RepID=UPI002554A91B|nr:BTAD domain-containing putative transcriptional regulator [Kineosporia sp. NBRC 101677]